MIDFLSTVSLRPIIILEYIHIENEIFNNLLTQLERNNYIFFSINENMVCFPDEKKSHINLN